MLVLCCQVKVFASSFHSSRGVLRSVVCLCAIVKHRYWGPGPLGALAPWNGKIIKRTCRIFLFKILKRTTSDFSATNWLIVVMSKASFMLCFLILFFVFTEIIWLCNYTLMHRFCAYYVFIICLQHSTLDLSMYSLLLCNIYTVRCYVWYTGTLGRDSPAIWSVGVLNAFFVDRLLILLVEYIFMPHF